MSNPTNNEPQSLLPKNFTDLHKMKNIWTFHYLIPAKINEKSVDWKNYLNVLHDFNTFENFWAIVQSIEPAGKLQKGCRYYIFKKGIEPLWEDEQNLGGKEISIEYKHPSRDPKMKGNNSELLKIQKTCEEKWIKLCIAVFCNNEKYFRNIDKINGIEFNIRAQFIKIGIWTQKINDDEFQKLIEDLHRVMDYDPNDPVSSAKEDDIVLSRIQS